MAGPADPSSSPITDRAAVPAAPTGPATAQFYDELAARYHLIFADWDRSIDRQSEALDAVIRAHLGTGPADVLDCACGIGTQAIGLARKGHRVTGSDLSSVAAERAGKEAAERGLEIRTHTADMRLLPFGEGEFDVVVCADNSLPHLLTAGDVRTTLGEMRRVLRPGGLLLVSTRDYDELRLSRPTSTAPQVHATGADQVVTFQLWDWSDDGERYDLKHFQLSPDGDDWRVRTGTTTYWAITRSELSGLLVEAGFGGPVWMPPEHSGFFQPLAAARVPRAPSS